MQKFFAIILVVLLTYSDAGAQNVRGGFINAGVKAAYAFDVGFSGGFEVSYAAWFNGATTLGGAMSLDFLEDGSSKFHIGLQGSALVGVEIGPTWYSAKGKPSEFTYSITVFAGAIILPMYSFTDLARKNLHELGVYIKYPIVAHGNPIDFH